MSAYCVDFNGGADWYAPASQSENFWDFAGGCARGWVVIESGQFQGIYNASQGGGSTGTTQQFTEAEVVALKYQAANPSPFNLTLVEGALIASAILGVWGIAVCWRELAAFVRGGSTEEDPR